MKALFLTQTGPLGPSSRYRVYQLVPLLRKLGIECEVSPAIEDELYRAIYLQSGGPRFRVAALRSAWQKRSVDLHRVADCDAVFVQKGVFPGLYSGFERKLAARKPLIFDFDDAIWLPRQGGSRILRALHRESAVQDILRCAAAVIAGNTFLADYASRFNRNVTVVPSAIDVARYSIPLPQSAIRNPHSAIPTVGWIGSSTTLPYLKPLRPVFETLKIKPCVIASGDPSVLGFDVDFKHWQLETELADLAQIDIGIAPLPDTPWERGKCAVKILQYMACGIPVVASPVSVHNDIVRDGETGFLVRNETEWIDRLRALLADTKLRASLGAAGRKLVEKRYSLPVATEKVAVLLRSAL